MRHDDHTSGVPRSVGRRGCVTTRSCGCSSTAACGASSARLLGRGLRRFESGCTGVGTDRGPLPGSERVRSRPGSTGTAAGRARMRRSQNNGGAAPAARNGARGLPTSRRRALQPQPPRHSAPATRCLCSAPATAQRAGRLAVAARATVRQPSSAATTARLAGRRRGRTIPTPWYRRHQQDEADVLHVAPVAGRSPRPRSSRAMAWLPPLRGASEGRSRQTGTHKNAMSAVVIDSSGCSRSNRFGMSARAP
jgi:hypothetical protein